MNAAVRMRSAGADKPRRRRAVGSPATDGPVRIVGLGASAGGLEAFRAFLRAMPAGSGLAFIMIQHLDPSHESLMADLLGNDSSMPVHQAEDGMAIEREHVYVIPPGAYLSIRGGSLRLTRPQERHGARMAVDFFLQSLAEDAGDLAIGVVCSGSGTDGTRGLMAIHERGGLCIVQDPAEASVDGMPSSAIAANVADLVLPIARMPEALLRQLGRDAPDLVDRTATAVDRAEPDDHAQADLAAVIRLLRDTTTHDFSHYKTGTLLRRLERRRASAMADDAGGYLKGLADSPAERDRLIKDLLINVTQFFRDPAAFDVMAKSIIPDLVERHPAGRPLRVWVPACSTGEEAYSLAILFSEAFAAAGRAVDLQIFASDVDPASVAFARNGVYPGSISADVSPERLARFFVAEGKSFSVTRGLRETVVFTVQNLLSDSPFSRIDLVSCRNLLIYLRPEIQQKILALFHFSLNEGGLLFLGNSETVGDLDDRFKPVSRKYRIYRQVGRIRPSLVNFPIGVGNAGGAPAPGAARRLAPRRRSFGELTQQALLETYAPASVLINKRYEGLFFFGAVDRFVQVAQGDANSDLLSMVRPGLRGAVKVAVRGALLDRERTMVAGAQVERDGRATGVGVAVQPIESEGERLLLVSFIEETPIKAIAAAATPEAAGPSRIGQLERELEDARLHLQSAVRELESAHEDQKVVNEEATAINEEFQATNEELEISKEELQSLNEELTALNSQLSENMERQRQASNDLKNILHSSGVATIFLDRKLNIRFFTPATKNLYAVIATDIGRPLADLHSLSADGALLDDARAVLGNLVEIEREVEAHSGAWYLRRVLPYHTEDDRIAGVVITFNDITERKRQEAISAAAKHQAEQANADKSRFLAAASHDLRQPLQTIRLLQGLLAKKVKGEVAATLISRLDATVRVMSGMLNTLLDINQLEAGVVRADIVSFPVNDLLDELESEFVYHTRERGLAFSVVASGYSVTSDPRLLGQMIRNLLANAVKYTEHGKVLLGCRRRGDRIRIEVWDTGIGIPEEHQATIFEEFHQLGNPARQRSEGLGLGLAIVQRLAKLMGHTVGVRSVPGRGSVFAVEVPMARRERVRPLGRALPTAQPIPHSMGAILVVDDDPAVREAMELLLESDGHRVVSVGDGAAALELATGGTFRPDLVIADYNLPGDLNGLALIERLKGLLDDAVPSVILTGDISTETLRAMVRQGSVHLHKPVEAEALIRVIGRLLPTVRPPAPIAVPPPTTARPPPIFVVDDDAPIRDAIRETLEAAGRMVEVYATSEAFLEAYGAGRAGCLLVDAMLPGVSGLDLLGRLQADGHDLPAIVITGYGDVPMAVKAMRAGAADFIEKPVGRDDLLASIERALAHSRDDPDLARARQATARLARLTLRQRQILELVLGGLPNKIIAARLALSQRTVESHRAALMKRTEAKSLPDLIRLALAADHAGPS